MVPTLQLPTGPGTVWLRRLSPSNCYRFTWSHSIALSGLDLYMLTMQALFLKKCMYLGIFPLIRKIAFIEWVRLIKQCHTCTNVFNLSNDPMSQVLLMKHTDEPCYLRSQLLHIEKATLEITALTPVWSSYKRQCLPNLHALILNFLFSSIFYLLVELEMKPRKPYMC